MSLRVARGGTAEAMVWLRTSRASGSSLRDTVREAQGGQLVGRGELCKSGALPEKLGASRNTIRLGWNYRFRIWKLYAEHKLSPNQCKKDTIPMLSYLPSVCGCFQLASATCVVAVYVYTFPSDLSLAANRVTI